MNNWLCTVKCDSVIAGDAGVQISGLFELSGPNFARSRSLHGDLPIEWWTICWVGAKLHVLFRSVAWRLYVWFKTHHIYNVYLPIYSEMKRNPKVKLKKNYITKRDTQSNSLSAFILKKWQYIINSLLKTTGIKFIFVIYFKLCGFVGEHLSRVLLTE